MLLQHIQQFNTHYATSEVAHAIAGLVEEGQLELREQKVRVDGKFCVFEKIHQVYSLTRIGVIR